MCRLIDQVLRVCDGFLDNFKDRVDIVLNLDPIFAALLQQLLVYIWLSGEDLGIVSVVMRNEHLILIDELLEVFKIQLLLSNIFS